MKKAAMRSWQWSQRKKRRRKKDKAARQARRITRASNG